MSNSYCNRHILQNISNPRINTKSTKLKCACLNQHRYWPHVKKVPFELFFSLLENLNIYFFPAENFHLFWHFPCGGIFFTIPSLKMWRFCIEVTNTAHLFNKYQNISLNYLTIHTFSWFWINSFLFLAKAKLAFYFVF